MQDVASRLSKIEDIVYVNSKKRHHESTDESSPTISLPKKAKPSNILFFIDYMKVHNLCS